MNTESPAEGLLPDTPTAPRAIEAHHLTYNDYLRVPELLELQQPQSDPPHHDEMLFIIIHQAYELWFKLILHELTRAKTFIDDDQPLRARHFVDRVVAIMRLLVDQIHIVETMQPIDFLWFRDRLRPASGFQSLQFREVEFFCGIKDGRYCTFFDNRPEMREQLEDRLGGDDLRAAAWRMLQRAGFAIPDAALESAQRDDEAVFEATAEALVPILEAPDEHLHASLLLESLIAFDEQLALWREHHVRVVARVIGWRMGTGGSSGVDYLKSTTTKSAFPELWAARTRLVHSERSGGLSHRRDGERKAPPPSCPAHPGKES
jgi:tryptophan 2,3-dioxygenase